MAFFETIKNWLSAPLLWGMSAGSLLLISVIIICIIVFAISSLHIMHARHINHMQRNVNAEEVRVRYLKGNQAGGRHIV